MHLCVYFENHLSVLKYEENQITVLKYEEIQLYHVFIVLCLLIIWFYFNEFFYFYLFFMFSMYTKYCVAYFRFVWACSILPGKEQWVLNNYSFESINLMYGYCVKMFADIILLMVHLFPLTIYFQIIKWGFL